MTSLKKVCEKLREHGRRVTPQRRAIVKVLLEEESHLTVEQILTKVRRELPSISPATVYNTLHELVDMDLLVELDLGLGLGERRYDFTTRKHDHLVCLGCGCIEDVPRDSSSARPLSPERAHGFQVVDRRVTYLGYCPDCAS